MSATKYDEAFVVVDYSDGTVHVIPVRMDEHADVEEHLHEEILPSLGIMHSSYEWMYSKPVNIVVRQEA